MKIILVDGNNEVIDAWKDAFSWYPDNNVQIIHGSIFDVDTDAIVSPANSFGFMDGGIDKAILDNLGKDIQERLQDAIKKEHDGELLVGQAEIVRTASDKIPFVISAPTMRVPGPLSAGSVNVYLATRAVFLALQKFRTALSELVIDTVAFPGMGTGVGKLPPKTCAHQMRMAYLDFVQKQWKFPESWPAARLQHDRLKCYEDQRDVASARQYPHPRIEANP